VTSRIEVDWEDPKALAAAAREGTGLQFLERIRDGDLAPAPIQRLLGFSLDEVAEGRVVFRLTPAEQHFNPIGTVHGGIAGTLVDSATGAAVHSTLPQGQGYTTLETSFRLHAAIGASDGPISCEGKVVHRGSRVATAEARLTRDSDERLLATGSSTLLLLGG
jgi:uncharacterized protein (TIGR00369 family)